MLIHDVYKIDKDSGSVDTLEYGRWSPTKDIDVPVKSIWRRRSDFKGFELKYKEI